MFAQSDKIDLIAPALVKALGEVENAEKNAKNPFLKNAYADLNAVLAAVKPALAKYGIVPLQPMRIDGDRISMQTILLHESGQWVGSEALLDLSVEEKGKSNAQLFGSAVSYYRRYQLQALTGIGAEDDDGQAAGPRQQSQQAPRQPDRPAQSPSGNGQRAPAHRPPQAAPEPVPEDRATFVADCRPMFNQLDGDAQAALLRKFGSAQSLETIIPVLWEKVQIELTVLTDEVPF
uniref:Putative Erf family protein n=1 Tax=viral metagenome TaxID=1070528 RepID=A0A6M3LJW5_9ZZZZ